MRHEVLDGVALGRGVLGMASDVEVEPGPVLEKDGCSSDPAHDALEQVTRHFVGAQPALPAEGASDPVLVLDPEYPALH